MPNKRGELTFREQKALLLYVALGIGKRTAAAIAAGYPEKSAELQMINLMATDQAKGFLANLLVKPTRTAERVLDELELLAFSDPANYFEDDEKEGLQLKMLHKMDACRRSIKKIKHTKSETIIGDERYVENKYEYELWDKVKALERLGEYFKLFNDRRADDSDNPDNRPRVYLPDNGKGGKAVILVQWDGKSQKDVKSENNNGADPPHNTTKTKS